jgi:predicted acylesterase/phospholipase RssA
MESSHERCALVLGGGGIIGFLYEMGVLTALEEALGSSIAERFEVFVGTSAGSIAAAILANGASAGEIYRALLEDDATSPFNFRPRDLFGVEGGRLSRLFAEFVRPLAGTLRRALRASRWPSLAEVVADFQEHHPPGMFSTEPLQESLCQRFTRLGFAHSFGALQRELYVSGTDLDTGERIVFGSENYRDFHICRAVAASCALPIFFRPVRIEDRDVVDGAISGSALLDVAVGRGARTVFFVHPLVPLRNDRARVCLPRDGEYCARISEKGVGWIGDQSLRLLFSSGLEWELKALRAERPDVRVWLLAPARDEILMFLRGILSFDGREEILRYGFDAGRAHFEGEGSRLVETLHPGRSSVGTSRALQTTSVCSSSGSPHPARPTRTSSTFRAGPSVPAQRRRQ